MQLSLSRRGTRLDDSAQVHTYAVAAAGVAGGGRPALPHREPNAASFGPTHYRGHIRDVVVDPAGTTVYAGTRQHTAAHVAAHLVQQQAGVNPSG